MIALGPFLLVYGVCSEFLILITARVLANINIPAYEQIECNSEVGSLVVRLLNGAIQLQ
jgi:hypothetical protein